MGGPMRGDRVVFLSGRVLGEVVDVSDGVFLVAANGRQSWLATEAIFTREGANVTLVCEPRGLDHYERRGPNLTGSEDRRAG